MKNLKKAFAMLLSLCMILSCMMTASAKDTDMVQTMLETKEECVFLNENVARNTQLWNTPGEIFLDGPLSIRVTPGAGVKLCVYAYKTGGVLSVRVKPAGGNWSGYKQLADSGHNWATLVDSTRNIAYTVEFYGAIAEFSGGIYTE